MAGETTIGFGARGSLDLYSGSGQGGGGPRQSFGRNLCTNPSMGAGVADFFRQSNAVADPIITERLGVWRPSGLYQWDGLLAGYACMVTGAPAYNRDWNFSFGGPPIEYNFFLNTNCFYDEVNVGATGHTGTYVAQVTGSSAAAMTFGMDASVSQAFRVWPGRQYTASAWVRTEITGRVVKIGLRFWSSVGGSAVQVGTITYGATVTDNSGSWQQITVTASCPTGALYASFELNYSTTALNENHYVDDVRFYDVAAVAAGGIDVSEDCFACYRFYAKPNTTYTFSGFMRHAPEYVYDPTSDFRTFSSYALRITDPNNVTDFGDGSTYGPDISVGTLLTGKEYYTWQRHAVTYTTGDVVTEPIELRLYGNKVLESDPLAYILDTDRAFGQDDAREVSSWYATTGTVAFAPFYPYGGWNNSLSWHNLPVGSYWDCIQIEESSQPSAYIDGTQRGCLWWPPIEGNLAFPNPDVSGDVVTTANTGVGTFTEVDLGNADYTRWFPLPYDYGMARGYAGGSGEVPLIGRYAWQYAAGANGARTRSGLYWDLATTQVTNWLPGEEGTLSFYARSISGDTALTVAAEVSTATTGSGTVAAQTFTLTPIWRRYTMKLSLAADQSALVLSGYDIAFRQANPTLAATFQLGGILLDHAPIAVDEQSNDGFTADYTPAFPIEYQTRYGDDPGYWENEQYVYNNLVSHRSVRGALVVSDTDNTDVGIPSFAGVIEASTIDASVINRSTLFGCAMRNMGDLRFDNSLYAGAQGYSPANIYGVKSGQQHITLYGDPYQDGASYGIGIQYLTEYFRVPLSARFAWFGGGRHQPDQGAGGAAGEEWMVLDRNGLSIPDMTPVSTVDATSSTTTSTSYTDLVAGAGPDCTVKASPSGKIMVQASLRLHNNTNNVASLASVEIFDLTDSVVVLAASDNNAAQANGVTGIGITWSASTGIIHMTGLVPGRSYRCRMKYRVSGASTGTFTSRRITAWAPL